MKYRNFTTEDFIADEYFLKWVLDSDTMCDNFWQNWLRDYPTKIKEIEEAKRFVLLMHEEENQLKKEEFNDIWRNIIERREDSISSLSPLSHMIKSPLFKLAAVILVLVASSLLVYYLNFDGQLNALPHDSNQVTLELEDGSVKYLNDENTTEILATVASTIKQEKNTIRYEGVQTSTSSLEFNQLRVPFGKKFEIALSDGTYIFLNSGSRLKYPVSFSKTGPREVFLDGEAYFDVEQDPLRPFVVITDDIKTQVLGTEFNVSSYKNERNTSTVLVEGSVAVYKTEGTYENDARLIVPGEQAVFNEGKITVNEVNVEKYIAWKNGALMFDNDSFSLILKELERNFNVKIENNSKKLASKKFTGTFDKESLEEILKIFSQHTLFEYTISEDKVLISSK